MDTRVADYHAESVFHHEVRHPKSSSAAIDIPQWLADLLPDTYGGHVPYRLRVSLYYTSKRQLGRSINAHSLRHW